MQHIIYYNNYCDSYMTDYEMFYVFKCIFAFQLDFSGNKTLSLGGALSDCAEMHKGN